MIRAYILIELSSGSKYKYVRDVVTDTAGVNAEYYAYNGPGYQEVGLKAGIEEVFDPTNLLPNTTYYFKVNIDAGGLTEYSIKTGPGVAQLFSGVNPIITFNDLILLLNSATRVDGARWDMIDGDLRCTSMQVATGTSIALAAGVTGTDLFASLNGWTGSFSSAVPGDQYLDQTNVGEVKKDYTDLVASYTAAATFKALLSFPESAGGTTILKRRNKDSVYCDDSYTYIQVSCGQITTISVVEEIIPL
jgi:hypothetical protein